jgi:hypothetical protein
MLMQSQSNYEDYNFDYDGEGVPDPTQYSLSPQNSLHRKRAGSLTREVSDRSPAKHEHMYFTSIKIYRIGGCGHGRPPKVNGVAEDPDSRRSGTWTRSEYQVSTQFIKLTDSRFFCWGSYIIKN